MISLVFGRLEFYKSQKDRGIFNFKLDQKNIKFLSVESRTRELAAIADKTNLLIKENNEILNDISKLMEKL